MACFSSFAISKGLLTVGLEAPRAWSISLINFFDLEAKSIASFGRSIHAGEIIPEPGLVTPRLVCVGVIN